MKPSEMRWLFGLMTAGVLIILFFSIIGNTPKSGNIWLWRSMAGLINVGLLWLIVSDINLIIKSYLAALGSNTAFDAGTIENIRSKAMGLTLKIVGLIIASWWLVAIAF